MFKNICIALGLALLASLTSHAAASEPVRVGVWDERSDRSVMASKAVLKRAYQELNQPVEFIEVPIRRALIMLLNDQLDANVHRAAPFFVAQPTLLQLATPVNTVTVRSYVRRGSNLQITQWRDVEGMAVTYSRGTLMVENKLPTNTKRLAAVSAAEMFRMVAQNMADIAIVVEPNGSPPQPLAGSSGLIRLEPVLDQASLYHALSSRHRDLAVRLNAVLVKMSASGEMKEIQKRALLGRLE